MLKIQDYLSGRISIEELEDWIAARLPAIYESGLQDAIELVSLIELSLIEIEYEKSYTIYTQ